MEEVGGVGVPAETQPWNGRGRRGGPAVVHKVILRCVESTAHTSGSRLTLSIEPVITTNQRDKPDLEGDSRLRSRAKFM